MIVLLLYSKNTGETRITLRKSPSQVIETLMALWVFSSMVKKPERINFIPHDEIPKELTEEN